MISSQCVVEISFQQQVAEKKPDTISLKVASQGTLLGPPCSLTCATTHAALLSADQGRGFSFLCPLADGSEIFFKCRPGTQLKKVRLAQSNDTSRKAMTPLNTDPILCRAVWQLMDAYCARQGVSLSTVRFLFDGERIREHQTVCAALHATT